MYCIGCQYELTGLAGSCPECGRTFDPLDSVSYLSSAQLAGRAKWSWRFEVGLIVCGCLPVLANLFGFAALLIARQSLGRWPDRGGIDDPFYISVVSHFAFVSLILVILSLPGLLAALILLGLLETHVSRGRIIRNAVVTLGLWAIGFTLIWWDPAQVFVWLWD